MTPEETLVELRELEAHIRDVRARVDGDEQDTHIHQAERYIGCAIAHYVWALEEPQDEPG